MEKTIDVLKSARKKIKTEIQNKIRNREPVVQTEVQNVKFCGLGWMFNKYLSMREFFYKTKSEKGASNIKLQKKSIEG